MVARGADGRARIARWFMMSIERTVSENTPNLRVISAPPQPPPLSHPYVPASVERMAATFQVRGQGYFFYYVRGRYRRVVVAISSRRQLVNKYLKYSLIVRISRPINSIYFSDNV